MNESIIINRNIS